MPAGTLTNVTWPVEFVVPETLIDIGPPVRVTVAPLTAVPAHVTVVATDPVGSATGMLVVAPATTVPTADALWPVFVAVAV